MWWFLAFVNIILVVNSIQYDSNNFRQEAAKVLSWNPKYIANVSVLTMRRSRHSPYVTSANITLLMPYDNEMSLKIDCTNARLQTEIFSLDFKICDVMKMSWTKEWLKACSTIPATCPVPAGPYAFTDVELPPKNFPVPLPAGDYVGLISFLVTKTREKIIVIRVNLRFDNKMG